MRFAFIFLVGSWFGSISFGQVGGNGGNVGGGNVGGVNLGGGTTGSAVTGTNTGGATTGTTTNSLNTNSTQPQDVAAIDVNQLLGSNGVTRGKGIGPSRTSVRGFSIYEAPTTGQTGAAGAQQSTNARRGNTGGGVGSGGVGTRGFGALGGISSSKEATRLVRSRIQLSSELSGGVQPSIANDRTATYVPGNSAQLNGIRGDVRGTTATISGQVNSTAQRDLATRVMLLNPGVDRVDNQALVLPVR